MQTQLQRSKHDPSETRCKLTLLILFLLGAALILGGFWGIRQYQQSGFDQEVGYRYIQKLSGEVESLYTQSIQPVMAKLTDAEREALTLEAAALLKENWTAAVKADQSARADEMLSGLTGDKLQQKTMELLSITYSLNGPKVASAEKKLLAKWTDAERSQNREALLRAVLDESAPLPQAVASAVGELTGSERAAALMQLFLVSANAENEPLPTDHVNGLKKAARNAEARISAYEMTADGSVTLLSQVLISHSRTAILLGILLALDIALLFLMLYKDHSWHLDFKWAIILIIVDFMLVFQVLPMVYLIIKAFFPEGSFTFDVFQRLYTYQMNLGALKNTLIAATVTMVLGTLIAFPLAWLVGRTNLFGKKFFRSLFVLTYMVPPYVGAMAWLRLLNPNVGTMNQFFRMIFGLGDTPGPLNIYTLGGLIWVLTTFYYPYAFITISRAMEKMDPSLEEASRISGASPLLTVFRVTLPMMTPSLIAGALLVFVAAMSCYGIPSIIGAPGKVHTVTTRIIEYNGLGAQGISDATGLAVFLMALAILILYLSDFVVARKQYITVSGKSTRPNIVGSGQVARPADGAGEPVRHHRGADSLCHHPDHLLQDRRGQVPLRLGELHPDPVADHLLPLGDHELPEEQPDLRRGHRNGGHRGGLHHVLPAATDKDPRPKAAGLSHHPRLGHSLRGHRAGPYHDHEGRLRREHLQHGLHHDRRLSHQIPDDGYAYRGQRHESDSRLAGRVQPDLRRKLDAHHAQDHRPPDLPLHRRGLVPDLHSQLLRAEHDDAALLQLHQDHRLPAVRVLDLYQPASELRHGLRHPDDRCRPELPAQQAHQGRILDLICVSRSIPS